MLVRLFSTAPKAAPAPSVTRKLISLLNAPLVPKRPPTSYALFVKDHYPSLAHTAGGLAAVSRALGEKWKGVDHKVAWGLIQVNRV